MKGFGVSMIELPLGVCFGRGWRFTGCTCWEPVAMEEVIEVGVFKFRTEEVVLAPRFALGLIGVIVVLYEGLLSNDVALAGSPLPPVFVTPPPGI